MMKETLVETQETAGFNEPPQRLAIGGHFNHLFMYSILATGADAGGQPEGKLLEAIEKKFSNFEGFKQTLKKAVVERVLPGWVWLGCSPDGKSLVITQTNHEDNPLMHGVTECTCTPIVGIDLWEHAYFSQYEGNKEAYLDAFLENVDWKKVSQNFELYNLEGKVAPILE